MEQRLIEIPLFEELYKQITNKPIGLDVYIVPPVW